MWVTEIQLCGLQSILNMVKLSLAVLLEEWIPGIPVPPMLLLIQHHDTKVQSKGRCPKRACSVVPGTRGVSTLGKHCEHQTSECGRRRIRFHRHRVKAQILAYQDSWIIHNIQFQTHHIITFLVIKLLQKVNKNYSDINKKIITKTYSTHTKSKSLRWDDKSQKAVINRILDYLIIQLIKKSKSYEHIGKKCKYLAALTYNPGGDNFSENINDKTANKSLLIQWLFKIQHQTIKLEMP